MLYLMLAASLVFVAGGVAMISSGAAKGWPALVFFGICAAVAATQLWPGLLAARGPTAADLIDRFPQAVELHASRKRLVFLVITGGAFTAVLGWTLLRAKPGVLEQVVMWLGLIFFTAGVLSVLFLLVRGSFIRLDSDGLTLKHLWRCQFMPWNELDGFSVVRIPPSGMEMVVFDYIPISGQAVASLNRRLTGRNSALPDSYGFLPDDLAGLLDAWRQRALAASGGSAAPRAPV